jgi:ABC-type transport system substrate-binding protein
VSSTTATAKALAVMTVLCILALAGCTSGAAPVQRAPAQAVEPGSTIAMAVGTEPTQYNPNTTGGDAPANSMLLSGVLGAFWRFGPDGSVQRTTDFGTYRKTSDDPLTVKYTIDPRAVWSDGVPIDCDDVALAWLANSGVTGADGFSATDVDRYRDMNRPKCDAGDKVITISYRNPSANWETAFGPGSAWLLPAHIVERQAGLSKTFVDYLDTPTSPDLAPAIAFWNRGWALTPGTVQKDLLPSSGPYLIDSWVAGTSITLKPNPRWWGQAPVTGTVVLRLMDDQQQVAALTAGQVQVIEPRPDPGILAGLKALAGKARVVTGYSYDFEHLDFNLKGAFADRTLREAFAKCVPRQQIVDREVKPLLPGAAILESRFVLPSQPGYQAFRAAGQPYDAVDVAGARQLLAGRKPTVRIGWRKDPAALDQGRVTTVALVKASCAQAGFTVVDAGTPTFLDHEWPAGAYDVALLSWTGSPVVTASSDIYTTGGASNLGGFTDPQVDQLFGKLPHELDRGRQLDLLRQIDAQLWQDVATVPLFAYPALAATSADVSGVVLNPTPEDLTWNVADWRRSLPVAASSPVRSVSSPARPAVS